MTTLSLLCTSLGGYLIIETAIQAIYMDRGDKLCRMAKYALVAYCAYDLVITPPHWDNFIYGMAIAAFFWKRNYQRWQSFYNSKCEKKTIKCAVMIDSPSCHECKCAK